VTLTLERVVDLLDLEPIEMNLFRGRSPQERSQRVFGGQVVGQALVAAGRTVEGRFCHSLKGDFLRPGDPKVPILYEVDRIRDGRSFTTRRVVAIQHGRAIFSMSVSFQAAETGLAHDGPMPDVPGPEDATDPIVFYEAIRDQLPPEAHQWYEGPRAIEERFLVPVNPIAPEKREPKHLVWIRAAGKLRDDPLLHQCVFAYASDMNMLDTCMLPHGLSYFDPRFQNASLDHSIWFHEDFRADEWLLVVHDSPASAGGRGFNRALVYTRDGRLVASVAQEGLIRLHDTDVTASE